MCCRSMPLCAAFSVGAEPRKIARASRLVTLRWPSARARRVDHGGRGRSAVDVGVDHRLEVVLQVLGDLRQHVVRVQRHAARQDQRRRVVALPQLVDDRGHQPQHAAGPLEPLQASTSRWYSRSNSSGWIGYADLIRSSYDGSATPDGNSARFRA